MYINPKIPPDKRVVAKIIIKGKYKLTAIIFKRKVNVIQYYIYSKLL